MVVEGRIAPAEAAPLCDSFGIVLAESGDGPVVCDVSGLVEPDAAVIDLLCRLSLLACRSGRAFAIQGPAPELRELLDLCGVAPVLPALAASPDQASSRGGRPKSGKNFSVSRKNVIPVILPPDSSST